MAYIYAKVHPPGLLNVTGTGDWARWSGGYNMSEAQMILYRTLRTGAELATWADDTTGVTTLWTTRAADLRTAINMYCWDAEYGAFKDNATATTLHPQDANSLAVLFGVVDANSSEAQSISLRLTENWTPFGAETPELPTTISPFISSFEIQAHLVVGQTRRALELIRRSWGWYLNHPNGTGSTVIEGYLTSGTFHYLWNGWYRNIYSYVSHAHGWSSGPTSALTEYVLGLRITGPAGITWTFAPQMGDLGRAEGGFTTFLKKFQASWLVTKSGYEASLNTPNGTLGELIFPVVVNGTMPTVLLDGKEVDPQWYTKNQTVLLKTSGGPHTINVT